MSATAVGHDFATRAIHYGYDPQRYQGHCLRRCL